MFPFIQDPVTISHNCLNGRNIRAVYEFSYTTDCGTHIATCVVDGTECSNGVCRHELQSNTVDSRCQPPVSQFSGEGVTVSVTARNILGRSNPAASRSISEFFHSISCHDSSTIQLRFLFESHCSLFTGGTSILGVRVDTTNPNQCLCGVHFSARVHLHH